MTTFWVILGAVSVVLLFLFWKHKNAVWGGLTAGIIIGLVLALIHISDGFNWLLSIKGAILGTLIGSTAELLGMVSDKIKNKQDTH